MADRALEDSCGASGIPIVSRPAQNTHKLTSHTSSEIYIPLSFLVGYMEWPYILSLVSSDDTNVHITTRPLQLACVCIYNYVCVCVCCAHVCMCVVWAYQVIENASNNSISDQ